MKKVEIDARKNILQNKDSLVSAEIDPIQENYPIISVYFPEEIFMYIDLDKMTDYDELPKTVKDKIGNIIQELNNSLNDDMKKCIKNMQQKLIDSASKIHNIPAVTGQRYGL